MPGSGEVQQVRYHRYLGSAYYQGASGEYPGTREDGRGILEARPILEQLADLPCRHWIWPAVSARNLIRAGSGISSRRTMGNLSSPRDAASSEEYGTRREHEPYLLETGQPGVFAAGNVTGESIKRIASDVGEGPWTSASCTRNWSAAGHASSPQPANRGPENPSFRLSRRR